MKVKKYIRYADDFVVLSEDKEKILKLLPLLENFLNQELKLHLHPDKVFVKTIGSGVDFLGWILFPNYRIIRIITKNRAFRRIKENPSLLSLLSYLGLFSHGNTFRVQ